MPETLATADLRQWIEGKDAASLQQQLAPLHPAEAAERLADLSPEELAAFVELVGPAEALTPFEFTPFELQKQTLVHLSRLSLAQLINLMSPDDRADLVDDLDEAFQEKVLSLLIKSERENLKKLLTYPEDSAGAHMTTNYALLRRADTVGEALQQLRLQAPSKETVYYAYVVDQARRLQGLVSLRELIMAPPRAKIGELMNTRVLSVAARADIEDAAAQMTRYDFLALPVVDADNRLVGIITYDDIYDIIAEEATEDMYRLANLDATEKISAPLLRSVRLRVPWLLTNLLTALGAAIVISRFTDSIEKVVALASMMTMVASLGGSAGTQTLTVVVRSIALGEVSLKDNWRVLCKETGIGLCTGCVVGLVIGLVAWAWFHNPWLAGILWVAMTLNQVLGGLMGALVPLVMRKLGRDPALGSNIFVTASTDMGGFLIFLGLATLLMSHLLVSG